MANSDGSQGIALIGIIIIIVFFGMIIPTYFVYFDERKKITYEQSENETIYLTGSLQATLDNTDFQNQTVNITIQDTNSQISNETTDLSESNFEVLSINSNTVNISHINAKSETQSVIKYIYPTFYSWPSELVTFIQYLPLISLAILVLLIALFVFGGNI